MSEAGADLVIRNIGTIVTGDIEAPIAEGDTIVVRDGLIASVGASGEVDPSDILSVIDAAGATVTPGLCDDHVHPVLGDFTPRQSQLGFIDSYLHGGTTTMISAGEPHTPGRPTDPAGVKALAILAHASFAKLRPSGVKVHAGAVLLEPGLTESDFDEMAEAGVELVGEIGISGVKDADVAAEMTRWAQARGMRVMVHTGGASIPGSGIVGADFVVAVRPDVAAHVNGGPTALPLDHVERILDETSARVEIVHNGNVKAAGEVAALVARRGELHRLVIGTDSPAGSGAQPLGMLRAISWVAALGGVDPAAASPPPPATWPPCTARDRDRRRGARGRPARHGRPARLPGRRRPRRPRDRRHPRGGDRRSSTACPASPRAATPRRPCDPCRSRASVGALGPLGLVHYSELSFRCWNSVPPIHTPTGHDLTEQVTCGGA